MNMNVNMLTVTTAAISPLVPQASVLPLLAPRTSTQSTMVTTSGGEGDDSTITLEEDPSPEDLDALAAAAGAAAVTALDAARVSSRFAFRNLMEHLPQIPSAESGKKDSKMPISTKKTSSGPGPGPAPDHHTTVMLRNLPNNYTRSMVCVMMDKEGFRGRYDFLYLPVDFRSKAGLGYAFVNLADASEVRRFWKIFHGYNKWVLPSSKVCHVSWSGPHQGQTAHVDRYRNSPIMHSSVPDEYKPAIFALGTGERATFPPPSKKLRAPRRRN
eukprot:TRINITY_DN9988_c0_g1_i1.p1 TRINITY_DN9988_c0_g1~~TRINITY_DN9988_c0_g1_i1.p1  ORF type:complete len:271 (-),score=55.63 TRINITY_DN9988_c0_g1_i1:265-1077(-)